MTNESADYADLVSRLREYCSIDKDADPITLNVLSFVQLDLSASTDAITSLLRERDEARAEVGRLREALKKIANSDTFYVSMPDIAISALERK